VRGSWPTAGTTCTRMRACGPEDERNDENRGTAVTLRPGHLPGSYPASMATSPLSPDEFRAAAEVYRELGPEYGDAVAESFTEKINREIEARAAQLSRVPRRPRPASRYTHRLRLTGLSAGALMAGIPLVFVLVVMHGSAAASTDWYQWLLGALLVTAVATAAYKAKQQPSVLRARRATTMPGQDARST
jgi:hypothetical protein